MSINERIKQLRKELKLSQREFAEKLGVTQSNVSLWEKIGNKITEQNIKQIAAICDVREIWLREGTGEIFVSNKETLIRKMQKELNLSNLEIRILHAYLDFTEEQRNIILGFAMDLSAKLMALRNSRDAVVIDAKVAAYRAKLEAESNILPPQ